MAEGTVTREENGKTYSAPTQADWDRGVRQEVASSSGTGRRPAEKSAYDTPDQDLADKPDDSPMARAAKANARRKRAQQSPQMESLKSMAK